MIKFVVAWEYDTGGGFEWYHTEAKAKKAFKKEKKVCDTFKDENWTVARYSLVVASDLSPDAITTTIADRQCEMFDNAVKKYPINLKKELIAQGWWEHGSNFIPPESLFENCREYCWPVEEAVKIQKLLTLYEEEK